MDGSIIILVIVIVGSFWFFGNLAQKWKRDIDEKLDDIKADIDSLHNELDKKLDFDDDSSFDVD